MSINYSDYLNRLVLDGIEAKGQISDVLFGLKEISGKLDTLITLKQIELSRLQPQQEQQRQTE